MLVGVAVFRDAAQHDAFIAGKAWDRRVAPTLAHWTRGAAQSLRLAPTPRSALHR